MLFNLINDCRLKSKILFPLIGEVVQENVTKNPFFELSSVKVKGMFPEHSPYVIKMEIKNNLHGTFL